MSQAKTTLDWRSAQLTHVLMAILAKSADSFVFLLAPQFGLVKTFSYAKFESMHIPVKQRNAEMYRLF